MMEYAWSTFVAAKETLS